MSMEDLQCGSNLEYFKLLVQSCFDTFQGETHADGLNGATQSFLVASTLTVVASLRMLDDESTLHMIEEFYKEMFSCPVGVAKDGRQVVDVSLAMQRTVKQMIVADGCSVM